METADPPDKQLSPTRDGSLEEGLSTGRDMEMDRGNNLELQGVEKDRDAGNSAEKESNASEGSDRGVAKEGLAQHRPISQERVVGDLKGSWVGVVQGQKVLKKYEVDVQMQDGIGSVIVPEEITKDVAPLWDDFLIGKFLDVAPHIGKVHAIVNKIWTLNDRTQKVEVFEVNETMMKFRILNAADKGRVLRRGMWNIAGVPVVLTKWSPVIEKEKPPAQSIPLWVHIKHVPINMFSWQGLSFVTSPIGSPVRLHPETAQCLNIEEAKIFVKVDLTKDLPTKMKFTIEGKEVMVEYSYPRLPTKCPRCEKWGHTIRRCPQENAELIEEKKQVEEGEITETQIGEKVDDDAQQMLQDRHELVEKVDDKAQQQKHQGYNDLVANGKEVEKTPEEKNKPIRKNDQEWSEISPGKASRSSSHRELKFGQVSLLTKSRFSVLEEDDDNEKMDRENLENTEKENVEEIQEEKDETEIQEKDEVRISRQVLPRDSKMNHRYLRDKGGQKAQDMDPSYLNKKKSRR